MNCPACHTPMHRIEYEGIALESCSRCNGEWLDHDEIGKITKLREVRFDPQVRRAVAEAASFPGIPVEERERRVVCPKCYVPMNPVNYGGGSGIVVDRCPECKGFWLDDKELEGVQMVVEGWDDALPEDLAEHSARLHDVSVATESLDETDEIRHSRLPVVGPFINACVNGIINIF